jgi:hypothetical protein
VARTLTSKQTLRPPGRKSYVHAPMSETPPGNANQTPFPLCPRPQAQLSCIKTTAEKATTVNSKTRGTLANSTPHPARQLPCALAGTVAANPLQQPAQVVCRLAVAAPAALLLQQAPGAALLPAGCSQSTQQFTCSTASPQCGEGWA